MGTFSITVMAGDGIGPEVTAQARIVLETIGRQYGHTFNFHQALIGLAALEAEGVAISDATLALCQQSDAILFGAVGGASHNTPPEKRPEQGLLRLRKELQLFANLRPVRPFQALLDASTIKAEVLQGTDMLVVRELTGGIYFGKPSEIRQTAQGREAIDTLIYTEAEIERILRTSFELARGRRKRVASVDKANVLSSSRLWREIATRVAADYPDIEFEHLLVDACSMHLIRRPASFDVIVTENMFGDILTDEAAMLSGSMGMLPSASLGTRQTAYGTFGLYEPIHGSAPDIVGQEKANPIAAILSAALLLRYSLGLNREADAVEQAVEQTIEAGYRTADIHESGKTLLTTKAMGQHIAEAIAPVPQR
ncbi:MAG TPA: 3-isopropylmalate dehydrogenase [Ktedonobacteraceae bacterium]|nr:3-isopropylmalate dehydrogenase [Ktedonobacteraceae bacterium]